MSCKSPSTTSKATTTKTGAPSTPAASGNATSDRNTCARLASRAQQCCDDPQSCVSASSSGSKQSLQSAIAQARSMGQSDQEGLRNYCNQMQFSGMTGGNANSALANACYQAYTSCQTSCQQMADSYSGPAAQEFRANANRCSSYQSKMSLMGLQGLNSSQAASDAELCSQVSQAQPMNSQGGQGSGDGATDSPYNMANANDPYGCQANPNSPGCARADNPMMDQRGDSGFGGPSDGALNPNDFNVGDASVDSSSDSMFGGVDDSTMSAGPEAKYKTVPNNSGGSIPGGGGSSEAKLDPKSRSTASSGPSVNTNIEQGFRSGGGGGYAGGGGSRNGGGAAEDGDDGFGYNTASANTDDGSGLRGLDLKRFLPGGSSDPGRFLGGNALSSQIHGPSVDLWGRISNRLQQRCRLGLLFGCS